MIQMEVTLVTSYTLPSGRIAARRAGALRGGALRQTAIALLVLGVSPLGIDAQSRSEAEDAFTLEQIHGSTDFSAESFSGTWMRTGGWATMERDESGATELWRVDPESGERRSLISAADLVPGGADEAVAIESFTFSGDERKVLLFTGSEQVWRARTKGTYYVFDLDERSLTRVGRTAGGQMFAKFSPDAGRVAFVRDHDLFVTELATGSERRLTTSGSESIINGTTDWVYEEELGLRDAFRWSPDGRHIAYWQLDQSPIRPFYLIDETQLYPELIPVRYPKPGTPNSFVRVGSLELETGETTWFDTGDDPDIYIARMEWAASSEEVVIQRLNRHQNRLELLIGDALSGETRPLLVEEDEAWVDVGGGPTWIDGGRRFLWMSERDGWQHVYLYERDGSLVRQLTQGPWDVTGLEGVDERRERLFFTAAYESPLRRSLLSVDLDEADSRVRPVLMAERGSYGAMFSPDFEHLVYSHSTIDQPPVWTLARMRGEEPRTVRVLVDNAELIERLESAELGTPEFTEVLAADGTPLNAFLIKPSDFDPGREYGLLLYVYGGPGSQTVVDRWGGSRYVWHQYLAQNGVLVASVDNRGTGARGRDFKKQTYQKLGQLETADQLAALSQLADLPYVSEERVGIWGWSYGGYMTLMATLQSEGRVAAGVSVAPVSDWKLYDTIYTERFMRTPGENPDGYERGSPLTYAADLESPLLIVHGTGDDNVHSQNMLQMVDALERADKQFRMRIYPNKRHGISGGVTRVNLFRLITDFVFEHLGPDAEEKPRTTA
jgi:dipeptidyl-peptidase-4